IVLQSLWNYHEREAGANSCFVIQPASSWRLQPQLYQDQRPSRGSGTDLFHKRLSYPGAFPLRWSNVSYSWHQIIPIPSVPGATNEQVL
ncbi:MAG: hypothetical protein ACFFCW_39400, partial [Candidatus Hodarchaeota archaeon]